MNTFYNMRMHYRQNNEINKNYLDFNQKEKIGEIKKVLYKYFICIYIYIYI